MELMSVKLGSTYRNDKQAAQFVHFIAEAYKADLTCMSFILFSCTIEYFTLILLSYGMPPFIP